MSEMFHKARDTKRFRIARTKNYLEGNQEAMRRKTTFSELRQRGSKSPEP